MKCIGVVRRASSSNTSRIDHISADPAFEKRFFLHYGDLTDSSALYGLVGSIAPDEIYNLAAQSHVKVSWDCPEYTADTVANGTLRLLEAVRRCGLTRKTRFYQASTSELYGLIQEPIQTEKTPFHPRSPYAVAKLYAYWICVNYRESFDMFAANGILFNHESPRRGENFVTRKITLAARPHCAGTSGNAFSRQPERKAGLGTRQRLCGRHVAHIAAGQAGRLCSGHGRYHLHPRILRNGLCRGGHISGMAGKWSG